MLHYNQNDGSRPRIFARDGESRRSFRTAYHPGTRITVWNILGWLGSGVSESDILNDYPELTSDDIKAALQFALKLKDKVTL